MLDAAKRQYEMEKKSDLEVKDKLLKDTKADYETLLESLQSNLNARIKEIEEKSASDFTSRCDHYHWFVHFARDLLVKVYGDKSIHKQGGADDKCIPEEFILDVQRMLDEMVAVFKGIVPDGVRVYAAIREKKGSNFHTIPTLRRGSVDDAARQQSTEPLHHKSNVVGELVASFKNRECVLITGSNTNSWQRMPNDSRGEDLSVMLGAVFVKKWMGSGNFKPIRLQWIVGVAANAEGVFNDAHKPLMKCYTDVFGIVLNSIVREPPSHNAKNENGNSVGRDPKTGPENGTGPIKSER